MVERILIVAVIVCFFVVIVRGIREMREEKRWLKGYEKRNGGPKLSDYGIDDGYQYYLDRKDHEERMKNQR